MSEIVKETAEYVEMSDSITLSIVKDGTAGTSINMKTGVTSTDGLKSLSASMGDSYIIGGHLWTYTGSTSTGAVNGFTDCGKVSGEAGKNNYVHVAWCKESDFNTSTKKPNSESVIKLDNSDGVSYEYMGTWVSETKDDTTAEAQSMSTWVYVKGDKGDMPTVAKLRVDYSACHFSRTSNTWDHDSVTVTIVIMDGSKITIPAYEDTSQYFWRLSTDNKDTMRSSGMGFSASLTASSITVNLYKTGGDSNVPLDTITVPMVFDGAPGTSTPGTDATVYTIEPCANFEATSRLTDASKITVSITGDVLVYKKTGDQAKVECGTGQGVFTDYCRLSILDNGNTETNYDGSAAFSFENDAKKIKVTYSKGITISTDTNNIPGSATITVYDGPDFATANQLASLVVPISMNAGAIQEINQNIGEIRNTTVSRDDFDTTIETIKQGQGEINLKVQDLQNGAIDTSKPHTKSQVDFTTLNENNFYPVLIRIDKNDGVRHTIEINRPLDGKYGKPSYSNNGNGFSMRVVFSDVGNFWGSYESGQLRIESMSQYCTSPSDTPICPKIAQYYNFSFMVAWLRGGSKYDVIVDYVDAYISGIWPYMMQVESNPSWVPDVVRFAPDTWTTAQVNAQTSKSDDSYVLLKHDDGGFYADTDNEYLYRFGSLTAGNTFAIVGQPKDSKQWFMATWHISSVSGSKIYVDISSYGILWQTQNPLGIRMNGLIGYIKKDVSYSKSVWDSESGFGTSESIDNTAVHANWVPVMPILIIGKESSTTDGVYRDRAVLESVESVTEGSSVSFFSGAYFDISPLYGTDGRTNVKTDLLATGIDIKSHKMMLTADTTLVQANDGTQIAMLGKTAAGVPYFNAALINAEEITVNRLIALDGDTMLSSVNFNGRGEFIQYYADRKRKMEIADGNIIYYNDDTKNSIKWIIGESGTTQSIDSWTKIELVKTDETGSNVRTKYPLTEGKTYSEFQAGENSTNAKYSGLTVQGTQTGTAPTASWLQKIPDGWYTNTSSALLKMNTTSAGFATGFATATRMLIEYKDGYKTGKIKNIQWATQADGVTLDPDL